MPGDRLRKLGAFVAFIVLLVLADPTPNFLGIAPDPFPLRSKSRPSRHVSMPLSARPLELLRARSFIEPTRDSRPDALASRIAAPYAAAMRPTEILVASVSPPLRC